MAEVAESWLDKNHFLLRRMHSLTGVVPIGFFLVEHLYTNSLAWLDPATFDEHVHWIQKLPYLPALELFFIFLPLAFHAVYGVAIARSGRSNVGSYSYLDNWRYTLQRLTGWIAIGFIATHLLHFRFAWVLGGEEYLGTNRPFGLMQEGFLRTLWYPLYSIGLIASVYHFANGLSTFCITWGITVGDAARRRVAVACAGFGVVLLIWGFLALAAVRFKPEPISPSELAGRPAPAALDAARTNGR